MFRDRLVATLRAAEPVLEERPRLPAVESAIKRFHCRSICRPRDIRS
jgi:hypothetical protein